MIVIFEGKDKNIDRNKIYDVVPLDTKFINAYLISGAIVSDEVFNTLNDNKDIKDCDNRIYKNL